LVAAGISSVLVNHDVVFASDQAVSVAILHGTNVMILKIFLLKNSAKKLALLTQNKAM
jgi:hypothetical protein